MRWSRVRVPPSAQLYFIVLAYLWKNHMMFKKLLIFLGFTEPTKGEKDVAKEENDGIKNKVRQRLTVDVFDKIPDSELLQTIFDNVSLKEFPGIKGEYQKVLSCTKSEQAVYMIWCLEGEVNNGGFNQYYYNSSGQFAKLTPEALRLVGANKFADLVARANQMYEDQKAQIKKNQDGTMKGFSESYENNPLNALDAEFYHLYKVENLQQIQIDFIRKHKKEVAD
jgi:uncharacterized protein DUF4375